MKRSWFALAAVLAACGESVPGEPDGCAGAAGGLLVVRPRPDADPGEVDAAIRAAGATVKSSIATLDARVLRVRPGESDTTMHALEASGLFTGIESDGTATPAGGPSDPMFPQQWHLPRVAADRAWPITEGDSLSVAVIDSGIDASHPELAARIAPGWSFLTDSADTSDVHGHGTLVAGTIAAGVNNGWGGVGVAPRCTLLPLVVLDAGGKASYADIAAAIVYAADRGVRIINVSIGGPSYSPLLQDAVDYAWARGAVVFAAAMNDATDDRRYPAACDKVVAVGAIDGDDELASFSNYGAWVDLCAPGDSILTTARGGGYSNCWGTSFASPIAAAVAGLALSVHPELTAGQLAVLLQGSARDLGEPGRDDRFGAGCVDADRAVRLQAGDVSDGGAPTVLISAPH